MLEIVKICIHHGPLTRRQVRVYKRNKKTSNSYLIQCAQCKHIANTKYMNDVREIARKARQAQGPREPRKRETTIRQQEFLRTSNQKYMKAADYATLILLSAH